MRWNVPASIVIMRILVSLSLLSPAAGALKASWQQANKLPPSSHPRSGPTAASDEGISYLFGGYAEPASDSMPPARDVVNDMLKYENGEWTQLQAPEKNDANQPSGRLCSASAIMDGELLMFGGTLLSASFPHTPYMLTPMRVLAGWDPQTAGTGGVILDDVWAFSLESQRWSKVPASMPGGPTSRHVACAVGDALVVHTFRCTDSVLVWDAQARALVEQKTSGVAPSSRGLHVAAAADDHTLVVFGGAAKDGSMCNDAFALDTRSWEWRPLATGGGGFLSRILGDSRPSPRAGACAATLPGAGRGIIVCCGAESTGTGLNPRADVWALTLDGDEGTWVQLLADDAPNAPPARNAATLTPMGSGELLLHGGWRPFVQTFGDSHILKVHSE